MKVKLSVLKDNFEGLIKEMLSLVFPNRLPNVKVDILDEREVLKKFGNNVKENVLFYKNGERCLIVPLVGYGSNFLVTSVYDKRILSYTFEGRGLSFLDFMLKDLANRFVAGRLDIDSLIFSDKDEILRSISKSYVSNLFTWLGGNSVYPEKLFFLFDFLSNETYEGRMVSSNILFSNVVVDVDISFTSKPLIDRRNFRTIRKLLELADSENLAVVARDNVVVGISRITRFENHRALVFRLNRGFWEILVGDKDIGKGSLPKDLFVSVGGIYFLPVIRFRGGYPEVYRFNLSRYEIKNSIKDAFGSIDKSSIDKLVKLVESLFKLSHGLILIITTRSLAESESERLSNKVFRVKPFDLFDGRGNVKIDVLRSITSIDGAIIVDTEGICYGIGVILDGDVSSIEDPSRGARFNSSIRYIESRNNNALAVILSDDGIIDMISSKNIGSKKVESMIESLMSENIIIL
ncbi:MAG: hypothetical protein ACK4F9_00890 [Brevinematia bacterium]